MESAPVKSKGRKRKRKGGEDEGNNMSRRKVVLGMRCVVLVGRYVKKEFEGSGEFLGKIVSHDTGLYRVVYEDDDFEDLDTGEAKGLLVGENEVDGSLRKRKKLLDQYILKKHGKKDAVKSNAGAKKVETVGNDNGVKLVVDDKVDNAVRSVVDDKVDNSDKVESSAFSEAQGEVDVDSESSSDLSDYEPSADVAEVERPWVSPPQLPLSSGNLGVPEEDVPNLLSVYSFLRSFSVCLFLSPFGLDEFVGALNCSFHNTLLDAIHVALIRALKSHVEILSSEGSELASKCLRIIDWSLLDSLTWPVFIVQYLTTMRYTEEQDWKAFYANVWEKDYYTLSAGRKLAILQLLCDDASNSAEIRTEIDNREESEIGSVSDGVTVSIAENTSRSGRSSKNSLPKDQEAVTKASDDDDDDGNGDECRLCGMDGTLICCDGCPSSYHSRCIGMMKLSIPEGEWYCPECTVNRIGPIVTKKTSLRGAEFFGIDPYEQVFLGSCDHLLVMKASSSSGSHIKYYSSVDIQNVLHALTCSAEYTSLYMEICKGILQYWEIPGNVFSFSHSVGIDNKSGIINAQDVVITVENANSVAEKCEELGFGQYSLNESNIKSMCDLPTLPSENEEVELGLGQESLNESNINSVSDLPKLPSENKEVELGFGQDSLNESNINSVCDLPKLPSENKEVELGFGQDSLNESNINNVCDLPKLLSENKEVKLYMGSSFKPQAYFNVYIHGDFASSAGASLAILSSEEKLGTQTQSSTISHRKLMSANYSLQAKAFSLAAKRFYWPNYEKKLGEVCRERCGWCLSCKAVVNSKRGCLLNAAASNAIKGAAKILSSLRQSKNVESSLASIATYVMFMEESLYGLTAGPFLNSSYRNQWQKHVEEAVSLGEIKAYLLEFERNIRDIAFSTDWVRLVDDTGSESQLSQTAKNVTGSTQKLGLSRRARKAVVTIPEIPDTDVKDLSTDFAWWRGGMLSKHIFQKGILPQMMIKHAARQGGCGKINGLQYVDGLEVPKRSRQFIWRAAVDMSKTASQLALQVRYLDLHMRWNELVCPEQTSQEGKGLEAEAYAFRNACIIDKKTLGNKISYGVIFENQKHLPSRLLKKILEVEETGDKRSKNWFLGGHIPLYLIKEYEVATVADVKNNSLISDVKHVSRSSRLNKKQLNCSGKNIFSFLEQKRDNMGKCFCIFCQHDVSFRIAARCNACQGYCHEQCAVGTNIHTTARVEFIITCKRCYIEKEAACKNEIVGDSPTSPLLLQGKESQRSATVIKIKFGKQNGHKRPLECSNVRSSQPQKSKSGKKNSKNRSLQSDQKPKNIKSKTGSKTKTSKRNNCLGLIWKKKNADDTGVEFRINNILLKGNPNGHLLAPKCHLCAQPYNSDLMYILCENCSNWFHADSVDLPESKILEVYGFKCCRCRRIRTPICPYTGPDTWSKLELRKEAVAKNQMNKNSEPELELNSDSDSDFNFVSETNDELINDWELDSTPDFDANVQEEHEHEHPFYSFPMVDQVNDDKLEADSGPGPKKLPVRRHTKPERESNPGVDISAYSGINNPNPDPIESSTPIVEWDVSTNGFADDMMFDYGDLNYEDMEFEPQTYFSFNELLASDEGDNVGQNPDPVPQVTGLAPGDCNPDQFQMGITYDEQEHMFSVESGLDMVPCRVCSQADPCPDLFCKTCGLWLHQHCSPWEEDSSWEPETGWKCGSCREWS
ncbi:DDT domain-containing protein PTM-like [Bidens hawaiensis]|uniref:DDT domain-containing protein PTM-like n=1 Tax=Bidens hawaiensis TaxID=980011 RepID=UPI004049FA61